jgi:hypothetical protein
MIEVEWPINSATIDAPLAVPLEHCTADMRWYGFAARPLHPLVDDRRVEFIPH